MAIRQKGFTLWLTGLPCAGKTTLANAVAAELRRSGWRVQCLDGDRIRQKLSRDVGFSKEDREIHVSRVALTASFLARNGFAAIVSLISPYRSMRRDARQKIDRFIEVYVRCPLAVCEARDVKGMYRLARDGKIKNFTGVSDTYEEPLRPDVTVRTDRMGVKACANKILRVLEYREWILPDGKTRISA
ncbi:MAG: adenylyl-sulfate kinase [Candidatus Omnitrophica bacterium]|nr:adenylyl-sulfate kinase [Candidatus Omnitrophota bacterium]